MDIENYVRRKRRFRNKKNMLGRDNWIKEMLEKRAKSLEKNHSHTGFVGPKFKRCSLCENYDFLFPRDFNACEFCKNKVLEYARQREAFANSSLLYFPYFSCNFCQRKTKKMYKVNTNCCVKCLQRVGKDIDEKNEKFKILFKRK